MKKPSDVMPGRNEEVPSLETAEELCGNGIYVLQYAL
jgi:hypothetical protein